MNGAAWVSYSLVMAAFAVLFLTLGAVIFSRVRRPIVRWTLWAVFVGQALAPVAIIIMFATMDYAAGRTPRQFEIAYGLFFSSFTWPVLLFVALHAAIPCFLGTGSCG